MGEQPGARGAKLNQPEEVEKQLKPARGARDLLQSFSEVVEVLNRASLVKQPNTMCIVLIDCLSLCDDMLATRFVGMPANNAANNA